MAGRPPTLPEVRITTVRVPADAADQDRREQYLVEALAGLLVAALHRQQQHGTPDDDETSRDHR